MVAFNRPLVPMPLWQTNRGAISLLFSRAFGKVVVHVHGGLDASIAPALTALLVDIIDEQGTSGITPD